MFNKLKKRWKIETNFQVIMILLVFSVTGSAAMYVRKLVFYLLGITANTSLWIKVPLYIVTIVPAYQMLLLVVGTIFGQYKFFLAFQKKTIGRFRRRKNQNKIKQEDNNSETQTANSKL